MHNDVGFVSPKYLFIVRLVIFAILILGMLIAALAEPIVVEHRQVLETRVQSRDNTCDTANIWYEIY